MAAFEQRKPAKLVDGCFNQPAHGVGVGDIGLERDRGPTRRANLVDDLRGL